MKERKKYLPKYPSSTDPLCLRIPFPDRYPGPIHQDSWSRPSKNDILPLPSDNSKQLLSHSQKRSHVGKYQAHSTPLQKDHPRGWPRQAVKAHHSSSLSLRTCGENVIILSCNMFLSFLVSWSSCHFRENTCSNGRGAGICYLLPCTEFGCLLASRNVGGWNI